MSELIQKASANVATKKEGKTLQSYVKSMEGEIAKALPSVITPERFSRIVFSALSSNPKLAECTPQSFLGAMMGAAQMGLEVNTNLGHAFLLPFRNKGVMECQLQIGYKGLIDLAYRSGEISVIQAHVVYENDTFEYELGMDPKLVHKPFMKDRGNPVAYYAMFKTKDGGYGFEVMSQADVMAHAQRYSKSYNYGPWQSNFEEMAKKTVLKKALKYAPLKSDFVRALSTDETIKTTISADMTEVQSEVIYVDEDTGEAVENPETGAN